MGGNVTKDAVPRFRTLGPLSADSSATMWMEWENPLSIPSDLLTVRISGYRRTRRPFLFD